MKSIKEAIKDRRSYYHLTNQSPVSDASLKELIDFAVLHVPSGFNSQSTRVVLLLNEHHVKLWDIVKDTLQKMVSPEAFVQTKAKIENAFQAGYGTILFYEDQRVVKDLQERFPTYADNFPTWSQHTSAMHQFAIWTLLESVGFGASLQHYNPLIDEAIVKTWNLDPEWKLIAQMPFGVPSAQPGPKEFQPLTGRSLAFA